MVVEPLFLSKRDFSKTSGFPKEILRFCPPEPSQNEPRCLPDGVRIALDPLLAALGSLLAALGPLLAPLASLLVALGPLLGPLGSLLVALGPLLPAPAPHQASRAQIAPTRPEPRQSFFAIYRSSDGISSALLTFRSSPSSQGKRIVAKSVLAALGLVLRVSVEPWPLLGHSWAILRSFWTTPGHSWAAPGRSGAALGCS